MNPVDMLSSVLVKRVLSPDAYSQDDDARVGEIIDHQGYEGAVYVILTGTINDANVTFAVLLEEGDAANLSDNTAVADGDMVSQTLGTAPETAAAFQFDDDNQVRKLGYKGTKRYTRLTITPTGNTSTFGMAACCLLFGARTKPVTQSAS